MLKILLKNKELRDFEYSDKKRGIGLGVFDGFHRGHQELVRKLVSRSKELGLISCIYTFSNHPAKISGNFEKISKGLLTNEQEKYDILLSAGVDELLSQEFTNEFSNISAGEFLEKYLLEQLNCKLIVVGYNYLFGKNREGNVDFLKAWGKSRNVEILVLPPVLFAGECVSSSSIRKSISKGKMITANGMLGRDYSLSGLVEKGQGLGTKLGFPTANFYPEAIFCLPANGVYVSRLTIDGRTYESITNIGYRPTAPNSPNTPIVETMVFDNNLDLYNKTVSVAFLHFLRKEKKFDSVNELKQQVFIDIDKARLWHLEEEQCYQIMKSGSIPVYGIKSTRFTTDIVDVVIKLPLHQTLASHYFLLSRVLTSTCKRFPQRTLLSKHLDSLYGADIETNASSMGDVMVIHFACEALHTWRGVISPSLEVINLLFDMLSNPDLDENGLFLQEIFESERNNLIMEIKARENNKGKYAYDKCIDFLTKGTVFNTKSSGNIKVLKHTTLLDLKNAYNDLINKSNISVFVAGNFDKEFIDNIGVNINKVFSSNKNEFKIIPGLTPQNFIPKPINEVHVEKKDVEQSKVCLAYKGLTPYFANNYGAVNIFNSMLGGDVHSLLFDVVREQMGLAYSVYSVPLRYKSGIILVAGVAHENVDIAINAMKEQVERIARQDFDDALFDSAMESVSYSYRSLMDDLNSMIHYYSNGMTSGRNVSIKEALLLMTDFSPKTISKIASELELSVVYKLTSSKQKN